MSKYDKIKTAADLVREVQNHGLSTAQDDICRAQDIFGNSSVGALVSLANDIGRNNENGEPDPNGSWSSDRKPTQGTFYSIAFNIWNWEDACRFWNSHTNPQTKQLEAARDINNRLSQKNESLVKRCEELLASEKEANNITAELNNQLRAEKSRADDAEAEIIRLKARLYDILCKEQ